MAERDVDPAVDRRRLRNILRRTRESLEIIQATAAHEMSWSVSKLIRIETGVVTISVNDLKALLVYYGITDAGRVDELVEMARNARRNSWLNEYRGIASDAFLAFLAHEGTAVRSSSFQPVLVPGLLQTDEYATAVMSVMRGSNEPERISRLVDLRIARQDRVFMPERDIKLNYLIDESVVRRVVGGPDVMKRQLDALIDTCQHAKVSLRIIPFDRGVYRSIRVPYVVLEFSEPEDEPVLFLEYPQGDALVREDGPFDDGSGIQPSPPTTAPTYLQIFSELIEQTSDEETMGILLSARENIGQHPDPLPTE